ncbi:major intrisic-like protein [Strigomonas culicis]|uniref:Major intrisic-like protein n=1 Tax=Strigomonas culicis TaxID=28005 RepID=S9U4R9_9TRYP|nr:major intrisic-like protein [Strigomonas culicis]EPY31016.1 major intrisic-like protein [Strigomonas culicis]|eukprot:EPY25787.1 major intrisic-like protein [Strigomonas culicis]
MLSEFLSQLLAELIGTFLFVLVVSMAPAGVNSLAPIPIGFMLASMCFTFGYISGAHFNPAVSFAAFINGKMTLQRFLLYVVTQVIGAFLASLYATAIIGLEITVPTTDMNLLAIWKSLMGELVYTFALASVVLHVCFSRQRTNDFYGFAIGMTVMAGAFSVGSVSGGAFNPALALGTQFVSCIRGNCKPLLGFWVYWVAPLLGALIATVVYQLLDSHDRGEGEIVVTTDAVF